MNSIAIRQISLSETPNNGVGMWAKWFVISAGWILLITALAKIVSIFGRAKILGMNDPILGIPFHYLILLAGAIELVISGMCLLTKKYKLNLAAVTWIAAVFLSYRFGLWYVHWRRPCPCLGNLTDLLHIPPSLASIILTLVAAYLFAGGMISLTTLQKRANG